MIAGDWGRRPDDEELVGQVLSVEERVGYNGARRSYVVRWPDGSIETMPDSSLVYVTAGEDPMVTVTMPRALWMDVITAGFVAESEGQGGGEECLKPIIDALGLGVEYVSYVRPW